jgi:hypothetical protein
MKRIDTIASDYLGKAMISSSFPLSVLGVQHNFRYATFIVTIQHAVNKSSSPSGFVGDPGKGKNWIPA